MRSCLYANARGSEKKLRAELEAATPAVAVPDALKQFDAKSARKLAAEIERDYDALVKRLNTAMKGTIEDARAILGELLPEPGRLQADAILGALASILSTAASTSGLSFRALLKARRSAC